MPKREKILGPKQKDRTTHFQNKFQLVFHLVSKISNWYNFIGIYSKLEIISKTLLTAMGRISSGGAFYLAKEKAFEIGGEFLKISKMLLKSYSNIIGYLQKEFEKTFPKDLQKQAKWCKCGPKCQTKRKQPCILRNTLNWFKFK
jgi:hypothetical protein